MGPDNEGAVGMEIWCFAECEGRINHRKLEYERRRASGMIKEVSVDLMYHDSTLHLTSVSRPCIEVKQVEQ